MVKIKDFVFPDRSKGSMSISPAQRVHVSQTNSANTNAVNEASMQLLVRDVGLPEQHARETEFFERLTGRCDSELDRVSVGINWSRKRKNKFLLQVHRFRVTTFFTFFTIYIIVIVSRGLRAEGSQKYS